MAAVVAAAARGRGADARVAGGCQRLQPGAHALGAALVGVEGPGASLAALIDQAQGQGDLAGQVAGQPLDGRRLVLRAVLAVAPLRLHFGILAGAPLAAEDGQEPLGDVGVVTGVSPYCPWLSLAVPGCPCTPRRCARNDRRPIPR